MALSVRRIIFRSLVLSLVLGNVAASGMRIAENGALLSIESWFGRLGFLLLWTFCASS